MTDQDSTPVRAGSGIIGTTLILIGGFWLLSQVFNLDLWDDYWPFILIVPGLAAFIMGVTSGKPSGAGLAIPGAIVLITGLLLLYQGIADHYESWAYAWALVAPAGPGVALLAVGHRVGDDEMKLGGRITLTVGLVLFVAGFAFFELLIGISGHDFGRWGSAVVAGALIAAGLALIVRRR